MRLTINGEERTFDEALTVAELLAALRLDPRAKAVAVNAEVVPRGQFSTWRLRADDRVEIVQAIGGGSCSWSMNC
ncbi:MAG: sulfur carrier protein ThiS [Candidatus Tectomicrobia bacterium]|nr:sulfur carrier protein ThiS [Candidatus Tectomicrobia bacterium]